MPECDRATCRGHRVYVGGIMDGEVTHLVADTPSDYPLSIGTVLRNGQRSWYLREASPSGDAVYRFVGLGKDAPDAVRRAREAGRR